MPFYYGRLIVYVPMYVCTCAAAAAAAVAPAAYLSR